MISNAEQLPLYINVFLCACEIYVLTHRKQFLPLVIQISNNVCRSLLTSGTVAERKTKL